LPTEIKIKSKITFRVTTFKLSSTAKFIENYPTLQHSLPCCVYN